MGCPLFSSLRLWLVSSLTLVFMSQSFGMYLIIMLSLKQIDINWLFCVINKFMIICWLSLLDFVFHCIYYVTLIHQVHVKECVLRVGSVAHSHATVVTHLYVFFFFKKKKRVITVHARCILSRCGTFISTWRWYRMLRVGSFFRLQFMGTLSGSTLGLSVPLLMSQYLLFQPIHSQRYRSLLAWSISLTTLMPFLSAKSEHTCTSRSMHPLPRTDYSRRLFCTISPPLSVCIGYEDTLLLVQAHPQHYAWYARWSFYMASLCVLGHEDMS